jgi:Flp pilus assembly protein TadD
MTIQQNLNLAIQQHQAGQLAEAEKIYRQILTQQPNHADALHLLGVIAAQVGKPTTAIELIRRSVAIEPSVAQFHSDLGNAFRDAKQLDQAVTAYRHAIQLKPDYFIARNNLGNVLCDQGMLDDGIAAYRDALRYQPDFAGAYANLGKALRDKRQIDESIAALRKAIQLQPDYAEARHNLALSLLLKGDFANGWVEHEWRSRLKTSPRRDFAQPRWDGSALNGRTILLHAEQGIGDSIHFARYVPMVNERGGRVVLQCQRELCRLLAGLAGIENVIGPDDADPKCDVHFPLLSLPLIFETRLNSIPASIPYLTADADLSAQWAARIAGSTAKKVGIVWAGAAGFSNDRNRSLPLASLAPLAKVADVNLYSLQKGAAAAQASAPPAGMKLIDHTALLNDFADTAALIAELDLVISVDTAVAHLAGAMGKPVWLLLPYAPDWRWRLERDDSPWYPTMRLFRQKAAGNWQETTERTANALKLFHCRTPT